MSTLIVTLPHAAPSPHTEYRYTLTADGAHALAHASAPAAALPDAGRAGEVVAVAPARMLSWQRAALPQGLNLRGAPQRLRAVLEGLLEEQLLDDPAHLHFALPPEARAGASVWVAVCDRAWLVACLQALEAAGRGVTRIVPELAPGDAPEWRVLGTPEDALLAATGQGEAGAVVLTPLHAGHALPAFALPPADAAVRAEPAVAQVAERLLGRTVPIATAAEWALQAARSPWNLAQRELAGQGGAGRSWRSVALAANRFARAPEWRAARWGAALAVAAHLVGLNAWAWQEKQALAAKRAGVRSALTQTFPHVKVVIDAPVQMEREVALLRQSAGSVGPRDLEPLLAAAGQALAPGQRASAIEYSGSDLRLTGVTLAPEGESRLAAAGYHAQPNDGGVRIVPKGQP